MPNRWNLQSFYPLPIESARVIDVLIKPQIAEIAWQSQQFVVFLSFLCDPDRDNARVGSDKDGGAGDSGGCEAIHRSHVERGYHLPVCSVECIERVVAGAVDGVAANHWRANDVTWSLPAPMHLPIRVHRNLKYAICTGRVDRHANSGSASKGAAHLLRTDLATDPAKRVAVQNIALARLPG